MLRKFRFELVRVLELKSRGCDPAERVLLLPRALATQQERSEPRYDEQGATGFRN